MVAILLFGSGYCEYVSSIDVKSQWFLSVDTYQSDLCFLLKCLSLY